MADETGKEIAKSAEGYYARDTANYGGAGKSVAAAVDEKQKESRNQLAAAAARAKKKTPMPKQNEGESPAAYSERLRIWRSGE